MPMGMPKKKGEKKGIKKGENRLGMLMKMLLNDKRYADAERASEDEKYREQLYKVYYNIYLHQTSKVELLIGW